MGLPLAELMSYFLLLAAGVGIDTKSRTKIKRAVGDIEWDWSLRQRVNIFFLVFVFLLKIILKLSTCEPYGYMLM